MLRLQKFLAKAGLGSRRSCEKLIEDNVIPKFIKDRYSDWDGDLGKFIHNKDASLDSIHQKVIDNNIDPKTRSGRQEYLENIINKYL